jgi:flagellar operon protein
MADNLLILPQPIHPTGLGSDKVGSIGRSEISPSSPSFEIVLGQVKDGAVSGVRFSKHATQRMEHRGIKMSVNDLGRLNQAVKLADEKGSKDSLVLLDSTALVVSVKDNTVVTVADKEQLKNNVFTNIDSAVIA